jgi:hypothetical protein
MSVRKSVYAILAVLAVAAPVAGAAASRQTAAPKPKLHVYAGSPVRVTGVGFHARERVKLTFTADGVWRRALRTTSTGRFAAVFLDVTLDRCTGYAVLARGASGTMATLKVMPVACAPSGRGPGG